MADKLQRRMRHFTDWIAPEKSKKKDTKEHAKDVLKTIKNKAIEMDIPVVDTMIGGSLEKETGLRRHMLGNSEVEGQDIDLVFVVDHEDNEKYFNELVTKFLKVADASYPTTKKEPTKCSVQLSFESNKLKYDLVPVYKTSKPKHQLLVRRDLERRLTSVELHTEFILRRTEKSTKQSSVVEFNECIRLLKWWRDEAQNNNYYLQEIPSVLIELLFAHVFDKIGVKNNYADTLVSWLWAAADLVQKKTPVYFNDYVSGTPNTTGSVTWYVIDPVNHENVVTKSWNQQQVNELAQNLKKAAESLQTAIRCDMFDDDSGSLDALVKVFGSAIKNHGGDQ